MGVIVCFLSQKTIERKERHAIIIDICHIFQQVWMFLTELKHKLPINNKENALVNWLKS